MKTLSFIGAVVLALSLTGCATLFGDNGKTVQVNSEPEGADVYVNNVPVGKTPETVAVNNTWSSTLISVKKPGYDSQIAQVNTAFQPVGALNILFWPGFVIDAVSGDMMKVASDSHTINVNLKQTA